MITVNYNQFYQEIKKASKCVGSPSRPILTNIKLYTKESRLYFECTNSYEVWQSSIEAKVTEDIQILFTVDKFRYFPKPGKGMEKQLQELEIITDNEVVTYKHEVVTLTFKLEHVYSSYPETERLWKEDEINYKIGFTKKLFDQVTQGMTTFELHVTPNNTRPAYIKGFSDGNKVNHLILPVKIHE
jgi:DNA polymerase III sliding clamp (beta) subunit (PCNA family)